MKKKLTKEEKTVKQERKEKLKSIPERAFFLEFEIWRKNRLQKFEIGG
jgi:hypothetical protein